MVVFTVNVVCLRAHLLDRLPGMSADLADSTRQLVRDAALLLLLTSKLDLLSVATRLDGLSGFSSCSKLDLW